MNTFLRTIEFDKWLKDLRDPVGKARIIHRIRSAEAGNFGDCEPDFTMCWRQVFAKA